MIHGRLQTPNLVGFHPAGRSRSGARGVSRRVVCGPRGRGPVRRATRPARMGLPRRDSALADRTANRPGDCSRTESFPQHARDRHDSATRRAKRQRATDRCIRWRPAAAELAQRDCGWRRRFRALGGRRGRLVAAGTIIGIFARRDSGRFIGPRDCHRRASLLVPRNGGSTATSEKASSTC